MLAALVCAVACTTSGPVVEPSLSVEGLTLSADNSVAVAAAGTDINFTVKGNVAFTVSSSQSWAPVSPEAVDNADSKDLSTAVKVAVAANESSDARDAVITVKTAKNPALDFSFTVKQAGAEAAADLQVTTTDLQEITAPIEVAETETTASVLVQANVAWTATSDKEWLTVSPASSEEEITTVTFGIKANPETSVREAKVTFSAEGVEPVVVTVSQAAKKFYTFELSVSDITSSGAVINVVPSDNEVFYNLTLMPTAYYEKFSSLEAAISADLAANEEYAASKQMSLGEYFSKYGYVGNEADDWNGYLDPETDYTAIAFAIEIDGDNVTPYVDGAKTIALKTLSVRPAEGLTPATSKNDYYGTWILYGTDFYAKDPEKPNIGWYVTLSDGGSDDKYEYVTVNGFMPFDETLVPQTAYNLIYKEGILYFAPNVVPYAGKAIDGETSYDLYLYCMNSSTTKITPTSVMCGGFVTEGDTQYINFVSEPGQAFVSDGFYLFFDGGALLGVYNWSLLPVPSESETSKVSSVTSKGFTIHPAISSLNPKRVRK